MKKQYAQHGAGIKFIKMASYSNVDHCILYPCSKSGNGYGAVWVDGKTIGAHTYALILKSGIRPRDKSYAIHYCRNRHCINPKHLRWGSPKDNADDRARDGTNIFGEENNKAKLSRQDVLDIRNDPRNTAQLAKVYNMHQSTIWDVKNKVTWKHIN